MRSRVTRARLVGVIGAAGFASGDRVVVGRWGRSPVGPLADVMWASPDGVRTLYAPSVAGADLVTSVYDFDAVVVDPDLVVTGDERSLTVTLPARSALVELRAGPGWRIRPATRPAWVTRWVERPLARALLGVETYGVSPTGVQEWYQATAWRPVVAARATVAGQDLGGLALIDPPCGFGFSEPPRHPSLTEVRPLLRYPRSVSPHGAPRAMGTDRTLTGGVVPARPAPSAPAG